MHLRNTITGKTEVHVIAKWAQDKTDDGKTCSSILPIFSRHLASLFKSNADAIGSVMKSTFNAFHNAENFYDSQKSKILPDDARDRPSPTRLLPFKTLPDWLIDGTKRQETANNTYALARALYDFLLSMDKYAMQSAYSGFFKYLHEVLKDQGFIGSGPIYNRLFNPPWPKKNTPFVDETTTENPTVLTLPHIPPGIFIIRVVEEVACFGAKASQYKNERSTFDVLDYFFLLNSIDIGNSQLLLSSSAVANGSIQDKQLLQPHTTKCTWCEGTYSKKPAIQVTGSCSIVDFFDSSTQPDSKSLQLLQVIGHIKVYAKNMGDY